MMDDLRDYRFYKEDMIHPSAVAEDYIWNCFQQTFFADETENFIKDWNKILHAINHKAFNPLSESHQKFVLATIKSLEKFSGKVDISKERKHLELQLI